MDVINTLRIINFVNRFSGFSYYNMYGISSALDISLCVAFTVFHSCGILSGLYRFAFKNNHQNQFHHMILVFSYALKLLSGILNIMTKLTSKGDMVSLTKSVSKVSYGIRDLGFTSSKMKCQLKVVILLLVYLAIYLMIHFGKNNNFSLLVSIVQSHLCQMPFIEFFSFVLVLRQCYSELTRALIDLVEVQPDLSEREIVVRLKTIGELHTELRKLTDDLNSIFSAPTTAMLFAVLLALSADIYSVIVIALWKSQTEVPSKKRIFYIVMNLLSITLLSNLCHTTVEEVS